jgi:homoserine O-acetyltransferase/O-succinyltransferase
MKALSLLVRAATCAALSLIAFSAVAADYPTPQEGDWVARDFRFHTGEVMPDLRLHYTTVGAPSGQPVLILHGTSQSGTAMLSPVFAAELFAALLGVGDHDSADAAGGFPLGATPDRRADRIHSSVAGS